jgi:Cu/Ag efflux pump CusA
MNSTSTSNGIVTIQVTFDIGTDVDQAAQTVNNRVKQAEAKLPQEVRRQGVTVEKGSSAFLQVLAFFSDDGSRDDLSISNYVTLNVLDSLKRVPGTTNVQIFGAKDYAMRIWLKPDRLAQLRLTTADVARAIDEQNAQFAAGKVGQSPNGGAQEMVYTITTQGRLSEPGQFEDIIVRADATGIVRLKDVARVELGSKDYDFIGRINGKPATLVGIFLQPGDPRRRQGRFFAQRDLADPDHRPRRAQRRRQGDPLRRPDDRLDGARHRRNQSPPRKAGRVQHGARHHAREREEVDRRHPQLRLRTRPRAGRDRRRRHGG